MEDIVNILHITDIHFGDPELNGRIKQSERETALNRLVDRLRAHFAGNDGKAWKPGFIFVTGDLAFTGREDEYNQAANFFNQLSEQLGVDKLNFAFCAGNHDIDQKENRKKLDGVFNAGAERNKNGQPVVIDDGKLKKYADEQLVPANIEALHQHTFEGYKNFLAKFYGRQKKNKASLLLDNNGQNVDGYTCGFRVVGNKIALNVINTAWFCVESQTKISDIGKLYVGKDLLDSINRVRLQQTKNKNLLNVTLMHHGFNWWAWSEKYKFLDNNTKQAPAIEKVIEISQIILNGHEHGNLQYPPLHRLNTLVFTGGALFENLAKRNNCEVLQINPAQGTVKRLLVNYKPDRFAFTGDWIIEEDRDDGLDDSKNAQVYYLGSAIKKVMERVMANDGLRYYLLNAGGDFEPQKPGNGNDNQPLKPYPVSNAGQKFENLAEAFKYEYQINNAHEQQRLQRLLSNRAVQPDEAEKLVLARCFSEYYDENHLKKQADGVYTLEPDKALIMIKLPDKLDKINASSDIYKRIGLFFDRYQQQKQYIIVCYDVSSNLDPKGGLNARRQAALQRYKACLKQFKTIKAFNEASMQNRLLVKLEILDNKGVSKK